MKQSPGPGEYLGTRHTGTNSPAGECWSRGGRSVSLYAWTCQQAQRSDVPTGSLHRSWISGRPYLCVESVGPSLHRSCQLDHTGVEDAVGGVGPHGLIDRCAGGSLRSVDSQVLVRVTVEAILPQHSFIMCTHIAPNHRVASSHRLQPRHLTKAKSGSLEHHCMALSLHNDTEQEQKRC